MATSPPHGQGSYYQQRQQQRRADYVLPAATQALLKQLRTPALATAATDYIAGLTRARAHLVEDFLSTVATAEITSRAKSRHAANRRAAGLPTGVTFEHWDPARSTIPPALQDELASLDWISHHRNLVLCGPHGTGKSMFTEILATEAIRHGKKVKWLTMEDLGRLVVKHRANIDYPLVKAFRRYEKLDLIVIDDIGLLDIDADQAEGFLRLITTAYTKASVAITSNYHPGTFDEIMPIKHAQVLAVIDRMLHRATVIQTQGESQRFVDTVTAHRTTTEVDQD